VAYYRVSTSKQGRSGLGLEAQRHAVEGYLNGGDWQIVGEFTEIETGKRADRPALLGAHPPKGPACFRSGGPHWVRNKF